MHLLMIKRHVSLTSCGFLCLQLKMVLIKCCDISNEVRPTEVAEPWVDCLLEEYFMQVTLASAVTRYQNQAVAVILSSRNLLSTKISPSRVCLGQSDREKSEGLPVAPFMDRDKVTKPTAQIGFIKFVLIPMFETVMKVKPSLLQASLFGFMCMPEPQLTILAVRWQTAFPSN